MELRTHSHTHTHLQADTRSCGKWISSDRAAWHLTYLLKFQFRRILCENTIAKYLSNVWLMAPGMFVDDALTLSTYSQIVVVWLPFTCCYRYRCYCTHHPLLYVAFEYSHFITKNHVEQQANCDASERVSWHWFTPRIRRRINTIYVMCAELYFGTWTHTHKHTRYILLK